MRILLTIIISLNLIFSGFQNIALAGGCEQFAKIYSQIEKRQEQMTISCDEVKEKLKKLLAAYNDCSRKNENLKTFYLSTAAWILKEISALDDLKAKHKQLVVEAGMQGLLLKDDVIKMIAGLRDGSLKRENLVKQGLIKKNERVMFGVPQSAMIFDDTEEGRQKLALLREFKKKEAKLFFKFEKEKKKIEQKINAELPKKNKELAQYKKELINSIKKYHEEKQKIIPLFTGRKFVHCLGVPDDMIDIPSPYYTSDDSVTALEDIPGLVPKMPGVNDIEKRYPEFKPIHIPSLEQPPFLRDGTVYAKEWAGLQHAKFLSKEMDVIIQQMEARKKIVEPWIDLCKAVFYEMPRGMVEGSYNIGYGFGEVLRGDPKGIERIVHSITAPFKYIGEKGKDLMNNLWGLCSKDTIDAFSKNVKTYNTLVDSFAKLSSVVEYNLDPTKDPSFPENAQSSKDYLKYADRINDRMKDLDKALEAAGLLLKQGEKFSKVLTDTAELLVIAKQMQPEAALRVQQLKAFLKKWKENSPAFARLCEKSSNLAQKIADLFRKKQELQAKQNIVREENYAIEGEGASNKKEGSPEETGVSVEEDIQQFAEELADSIAEEEMEFHEQFEQKPKGELERLAEENPSEFEKKVKDIIKNERVWKKGHFKEVYDKGNEVLQVAKPDVLYGMVDTKALDALIRDDLGLKRLDEVGVGHIKASETKIIKTTILGREVPVAVRVAEKVQNLDECLGENVLKKGKWTEEHTKALAEAFAKLNQKYIALDPNPGNFYFKRNRAGKLECHFLEGDGIVGVQDFIERHKENIKVQTEEEIRAQFINRYGSMDQWSQELKNRFNETVENTVKQRIEEFEKSKDKTTIFGEIDISTVEGRKKIQEMILKGVDMRGDEVGVFYISAIAQEFNSPKFNSQSLPFSNPKAMQRDWVRTVERGGQQVNVNVLENFDKYYKEALEKINPKKKPTPEEIDQKIDEAFQTVEKENQELNESAYLSKKDKNKGKKEDLDQLTEEDSFTVSEEEVELMEEDVNFTLPDEWFENKPDESLDMSLPDDFFEDRGNNSPGDLRDEIQ